MRVVEISSNDAWARDCGPTFVVNNQGLVRLVDWGFNAWGGLYDGLYFPWDKDQLVARKIAEIEQVDRYRRRWCIEGGSIHVDGEGTVITTEECLLSPGRNPELSAKRSRAISATTSGWTKFCGSPGASTQRRPTGMWTTSPASCVRALSLLLSLTTRTTGAIELLEDNLAALEQATDAKGRRLHIETIPMPAIMEFTEEEVCRRRLAGRLHPTAAGDKTAASYLNFLIVNGGVVLPAFDDPND